MGRRGSSGEEVCIAALWGDPRLGEEIEARLGCESVTMDRAAGVDQLMELIRRKPVDCIVCAEDDADGQLPMLGEVVERTSGRVPVIFLASGSRQDMVIRAFRLGASDCLAMSDACDAELVAAILRHREKAGYGLAADGSVPDGSFGDIEMEECLLPPEHLIRKLDEMRLGRSVSGDGGVAILAIEIAEIAFFASKFGNRTIDDLSREFARRLKLALAGSGHFCRRPDATFVVLLRHVSGFAALEMAISRISNELSFAVQLSDLDFRIESVIGACDSSASDEALALIERADKSLEKALARGARYHIAGPDLYGTALQRSTVRGRGRRANRRAGKRTRVHKRGRLVLPHLNATVDCIVLDVSASGARLRITSSLVVPEEFDLILPFATEARRVNVRWRRHRELGVIFAEILPG